MSRLNAVLQALRAFGKLNCCKRPFFCDYRVDSNCGAAAGYPPSVFHCMAELRHVDAISHF
jgi:hypothetical protein